jgi:hypothetical protein
VARRKKTLPEVAMEQQSKDEKDTERGTGGWEERKQLFLAPKKVSEAW